MSKPSFTVGIEEEYLLVDPQTRELATNVPDDLLTACESKVHELVKPEFLKSQIEVSTSVWPSIPKAIEELALLRRSVADVSNERGLAPIAASTHPFSEWREQEHTDAERYHMLHDAMQAVARRLVICGMHVHVGIEDEDLRLDLMNQAVYFLPHLLALSTSSPLWRGEDTGLKSYRLSIFDALPRTGLPERFDSFGEYQRHVNVLTKAGVIKDATMLWWDIRPSHSFPTIEMRITDVCTSIMDAAAIAALFQCVLHRLWRLRRDNQRWRTYADMLVQENRWRAQRYGLAEGLIDFGKGAIVSCADLGRELIEMLMDDAQELGCAAELAHTATIVKRGTSADRQIAIYQAAIEKGADSREAAEAVVDFLVKETVADT
ncbi:MAG: carboxylate-amine ligase [Magnetovibrionaceae bacterium]